jgi:DUF971 family protein/molybdopterin converting factor small subunit
LTGLGPIPEAHASTHRHPTEIKLHAKSRLLTVGFDDGAVFELPCGYLRVFSRAAEVRAADHPITGKKGVNISSIEPLGQYAIRILFDDGHETGIFSWDTLYTLGRDKDKNWTDYLERLERMGYQRQEPDQGEKRIRLLYFSWLAKKMRKESEQLTLPTAVANVDGLLQWLGRRQKGTAALFAPGRLRVTVNKQFSEGFTKLHEGDEIGLVPTTPTAPATHDLI